MIFANFDGTWDWTAIGTLALATVTAIALVVAWLSLRQTKRDLALSRNEIEEAHRPVVVPLVNEPDGHVPTIGDNHTLQLPVQNIGSGPALQVEASVRFLTGVDPITNRLQLAQFAGSEVGIGVGHMTWLDGGERLAVAGMTDFEVWLSFEDVAGKRWVTYSRWHTAAKRYADSAVTARGDVSLELAGDSEPAPVPPDLRTTGEWIATVVMLGSMLALLSVAVIDA